MQLHNEENLKKAESDLKVVARMMDEYIRCASRTEGDMVDGRYAEVESRYLDGEGKVKKYRDEINDRKCITIG